MTCLAYCDRSVDPGTVFDLVDGRALDRGERYDALLPLRLDFNIQIIKLPAISVREIDGFLRYRSRSLYPGRPGETSIDYSLFESRGDRYAVLFLAKSAAVESYRQAAGSKPLVLPFSFYKPYLQRFSRQTVVCSFWHQDWIDLFLVASETDMRATVIKRESVAERQWARFRRSLPSELPEDALWLFICSSSDRDAIRSQLTEEEGRKIRFVLLEELNPRSLPRKAVFAERRPKSRAGSLIAVPVLTAIFLFFTILLIKKCVDRQEAHRNQLHQVFAEYEQSSERAVAIENELESLLNKRERLATRIPIQPYTVLSELWAVLGSSTIIQSFTLNNRTFEAEAIGYDPLEKMKLFGDSDYLQDVKLLQIIPLTGSDQELFRIRGKFDAQ